MTGSIQQYACSRAAPSKRRRWVNAQISGYKIVDPYASCSEDIMKSSKTAFYEVFEGEPISVSEDGEPTLVDPVFSSPHFYTV